MTAAAVRAGTLSHRPGLDSLRGVAVLTVVASHATGQRGAQVGVTLFFVLSGFLITRLLIEEREATGGVSLGRFYERRARRLLPAMVLVVVAMAACGLVARGELLAVVLYYANWAWISGELGDPLSHFWSLAVEEQFYLLWPVVFVVARRPAVVVSVAAVGSMVSRFAAADPLVAIYGSHTRGEALLIGCLCALLFDRLTTPSRNAGRLAWMLLAVLAVGLDDGGRSFSTWGLTAVAVAAAVVLMRAFESDGHRVLEHFGRISYGLYLIHVPLWVTLRGYGWGGTAVALVTSWGLAVLSLRLVERRFRVSRRSSSPTIETRCSSSHTASGLTRSQSCTAAAT